MVWERTTGLRNGVVMPKHTRTKDETRIMASIAIMPGGGATQIMSETGRAVGKDGGPVTLTQVADYLEALQKHVARWSQDAQDSKSENDRLWRDIEGMRRLFGLPERQQG